jgi:RNA polymerase sigma-70 factor (ECF subfamily)
MISLSPTPRTTARELVPALVAREPWAERELLERFTAHVERIIVRITGTFDLDERVQDVFLRVLDRIGTLREAESLPGFITQIAVFVAREALRARQRKRWLLFFAPAEMPDCQAPSASEDVKAAISAFYAVIDRLGTDERIAFVLRHVDGMELTEVAEACGVSLATIKRRLASAERVFAERAGRVPDLEPWLERSSKWAHARTAKLT